MTPLREYFTKTNKESISEEVVEELTQAFLGKTKFDPSRCSVVWKEAIWFVLFTSVRENWTPDGVKQHLEALVAENVQQAIENCLKKYGDEIKSMVGTVKWDNPQVVDMEWTVSKGLESRDLVRIGIPSTKITLYTIPAGETASIKVHFDCDPYQLQDLHWKVKEALNAYQQLKRN